jgi:hypothetical protein
MSPEVVNKLRIIVDCGRNPQMKLASAPSAFPMCRRGHAYEVEIVDYH